MVKSDGKVRVLRGKTHVDDDNGKTRNNIPVIIHRLDDQDGGKSAIQGVASHRYPCPQPNHLLFYTCVF